MKRSYLVAVLGIESGLLMQCYANHPLAAQVACEAMFTDTFGEKVTSVHTIDRDALPGVWLEGTAEYIASIVFGQQDAAK